MTRKKKTKNGLRNKARFLSVECKKKKNAVIKTYHKLLKKTGPIIDDGPVFLIGKKFISFQADKTSIGDSQKGCFGRKGTNYKAIHVWK
jgi:hypothetical protein